MLIWVLLTVFLTNISCPPVHQRHRHVQNPSHQIKKSNKHIQPPISNAQEPLKADLANKLRKSVQAEAEDDQSDGPLSTLPSDMRREIFYSTTEAELAEKSEARRGIKIGLRVKLPTTKRTEAVNQQIIQNVLNNIINDTIGQQIAAGASPEQALGILTHVGKKRMLKPAYKCDEWIPKYRICILERNIGDTVTFYLSTGKSINDLNEKIVWKKEYHMKNSVIRRETKIDAENSPENIIVGNRGLELRVSPITEIDLGFNLFSATLEGEPTSLTKLLFMVRIAPIDLGFVYVGETIEINLRSFVSLPSDSLTYKWYMEKDGEHGTLPSNMKVTATGSSIKISELRQDQEGILATSVYTNRNFLATKKRFLIKDLEANFDVLKMSPDHDISFKESTMKRSYYGARGSRSKRDEDVNALINKALNLRTASDDDSADNEASNRRLDQDYNLEADLGLSNPGSSEVVEEGNADGRIRNNQAKKNNPDQLSLEMQGDDDLSLNVNQSPADQDLQPADALLPSAANDNLQNVNDAGRQTGGRQDLASRTNEFILNIDRFPGRNRVSAEETAAKLISYCINDSDCSERAICIRDNIQSFGFCKCLPGFTGVGIFCRENIWMSNDNIAAVNRENPQNPEVQTGPSLIP